MAGVDPISNIADAAGKLFDLVRTTIPTEAERAKRWILRYPNKYRRAKKVVLNRIYKDLKDSFGIPTISQISNIVDYEQGQLEYTERENLKCNLCDRFGINL